MSLTTHEGLLDHASQLLADQCGEQAYVTWSREFLANALTEAYAALCSERPDAFAETKSVILGPGSTHTLDDALLIAAISSGGESVSEEDTDRTYDLGKILAPMACSKASRGMSQDGTTIIRSVKVNPNDPNSFTVVPTIPEGSSAELTATVHNDPPCVSEDNLATDIQVAPKYAPALVEYVLYRALGRDTSDTTSARLATAHLQAFKQCLDRGYTRYSQMESGYYGGAMGDGDPQVVRG